MLINYAVAFGTTIFTTHYVLVRVIHQSVDEHNSNTDAPQMC